MSGPRFANCVFCDDVRAEVGNKTSLMGIYQSDMIFPQGPPAITPKICVAFWLVTDLDDRPKSVTLRLLAPNGSEIMRAPLENLPEDLPYAEGALKRGLHGVLQVSPAAFTEEGFLELWIDTEQEPIRAGRLRIRFLEPLPPELQPRLTHEEGNLT
jgi:hypothetical protein